MKVELVYASDAKTCFRADIAYREALTIEDVINECGLRQAHPELIGQTLQVGIFSQAKALTDHVKAGDRVEIYRPLTIDPKDARRIRAENKRKKLGIKLFGA